MWGKESETGMRRWVFIAVFFLAAFVCHHQMFGAASSRTFEAHSIVSNWHLIESAYAKDNDKEHGGKNNEKDKDKGIWERMAHAIDYYELLESAISKWEDEPERRHLPPEV